MCSAACVLELWTCCERLETANWNIAFGEYWRQLRASLVVGSSCRSEQNSKSEKNIVNRRTRYTRRLDKQHRPVSRLNCHSVTIVRHCVSAPRCARPPRSWRPPGLGDWDSECSSAVDSKICERLSSRCEKIPAILQAFHWHNALVVARVASLLGTNTWTNNSTDHGWKRPSKRGANDESKCSCIDGRPG